MLFAAVVSEALGGGIGPTPFIAPYVMAPIAIKHAGSKIQQENYLSKIATSEYRFGVGFSEFIGKRNDAGITFSDNTLNGRTMFALDANDATHLLLADEKGQIFVVDAKSANIEIVKLTTVDKTRQYSEVICKNLEAELLENSSDSSNPINQAIDGGRVMLAADSLGASQTMIEKAVDYAKERKQFGRAIGSFQAVKHMCAEMAADLEPCYAMLWQAAHSFDHDPDEARLQACPVSYTHLTLPTIYSV